ncbi:MAG: hypothetical protein M9933_02340 [Chitinophagaceae bacterium]|nr:hypothetical protein [Chitinophagaceae bacterium]
MFIFAFEAVVLTRRIYYLPGRVMKAVFLYLCRKLQLVSIICLKQLSKIASVFVMLIMLLSIMKTSILYTVYEYDKAFFIELFCVNKDRPQLKCNGHCKLAQMQQEENEKNADNILKQLQSEIVYFSPVSMSLIDKDCFLVTNKIQFPSYHNQLYSFLFTAKLIKPPATLLG